MPTNSTVSRSPIQSTGSGRSILAAAHAALGRGDIHAAAAGYREVIRQFGPKPEWLANLGAILLKAGQHAEAIDVLRRVSVSLPNHPSVLSNLGYALLQSSALEEARQCLEKATQRDPRHVEAWNNLGLVLLAQEDYPRAESAFLRALELAPRYTPALSNWCDALLGRGRFAEACDFVAARAERDPENADAWFKYGYVLAMMCDFERAQRVLERAATLAPTYAPIYHNLGTVALWQNNLHDAVRWFRLALDQNRDDADARFGLAQTLLKLRQSDEGWKYFEARNSQSRPIDRLNAVNIQPWAGDSLQGGTLVVHCDQGLGDVLQFVRFLSLARERAGQLLLHCDGYWAPLRRLVATAEGLDGFVDQGAGRVRADAVCSMLSLPHLLQLGNSAFIARAAYLRPPVAELQYWRRRLADVAELRVGLCWGGNPRINQPFASRIDERRSVPLALLGPLFELPGIRWFSLQKGPAADTNVSARDLQQLTDWTGSLADYADTAALIANLDLVISVDTSIVHCAGAMGVPVWMLDRFDNCWRWGTDPEHPGWYTSLRVFRQLTFGLWAPVIDQVRQELEAWAAHRMGTRQVG